jgi:hypothetical protein
LAYKKSHLREEVTHGVICSRIHCWSSLTGVSHWISDYPLYGSNRKFYPQTQVFQFESY